jgi:hypothetical protein
MVSGDQPPETDAPPLPAPGFIGCLWGLLAGAVVLAPEPPTALPPVLPDEPLVVLDELVVLVLETPAAPPPLLLPTEELFVFLAPGLVALGVCLAGLIEVVVGTPPPPQALSSVALASSPAARSLGREMSIISLYHGGARGDHSPNRISSKSSRRFA